MSNQNLKKKSGHEYATNLSLSHAAACHKYQTITQHSSPSHVGHFMHQHMTFSCLTDHRAPRGLTHFKELPLNTSSLTAAVSRPLSPIVWQLQLFSHQQTSCLIEVTWLSAGVPLQRGRKKAAWVETVTRYENVPKRHGKLRRADC